MRQYRPLIVLIVVSVFAGIALTYSTGGGLMGWMHGFMGVSLLIFASLKLFNAEKFAEGFAKYDMIGSKSHGYALAYPFIELGLGLAYLAHYQPRITYIATIAVFAIGLVGVQSALKRGLKTNCACMGTILDVPLSSVTLTEDILMIGMAAAMLAQLYI